MIALYDGGRSVMKTISWVLSVVYGLPSFPAWKTLIGDELKARWILLRSIEWINWPLFISQSVVAPLLWFYEWQPVVVAVIVVTIIWRLTIATRRASVKLVELGPPFVCLKFLICPIMALLIWWQGDRVGAVVALLWPVELTRHRRLRQRSSQSADSGKIIWTRTSKGAAMTELDGYWADVAVTEENKFAFTAYSKDSGREVITWFDYETEQQAMHAAVDFMRDGKDPSAQTPENQPKKFAPADWSHLSRKEVEREA